MLVCRKAGLVWDYDGWLMGFDLVHSTCVYDGESMMACL